MAKPILGIDIGATRLKLVLVNGGKIKKIAIEPVPENILNEGQVVSIDTMSDVIKQAMAKNKIHAKEAALVLTSENVYVRNVTMPQMTHEQLLYNLPYEFKDYITKEPKDYIFDYAMISTVEEMNENKKKKEDSEANGEPNDAYDSDAGLDGIVGGSMDLTAVVAPRELLEDSFYMLKKAGVKMVKAAPTISAYSSLIRRYLKNHSEVDRNKEFCILDLGYRTIRMYMFNGENHNVTRVLETGLSTVDYTIAEQFNVDIHLAHTYMLTNHEDCQNSEACVSAFGNIAVEIMRVLNFYRFSNPDSRLEDIWICGGGASIPALRKAVEEMIDLSFHPGSELISGTDVKPEYNNLLLATGIALDR